jgi:hypothetical protein
MFSRFNCISHAILFVSCAWVSDAFAISVPYDHDSYATEGLVNFPPVSEMPFAALQQSIREQHEEKTRGPHHKEYHQLWDRHPGHGYGLSAHRDEHKDFWHGDKEIPHPHHSTGHCPPIKPPPNAVPVPAALWLFLSGLLGLGLTGKSRRR